MRLFHKVAIVGTGLIGGSIALAIKKKNLADEVIGVSRHKKTLLIAKKARAIDKGSQEINIIKDADLVILATPVNTILSLAPKIARVLKKDCLVTDVGSTKREIVARLTRIFPRYVGAHPLAGSQNRGMPYANPDIFRNSLCILTPVRNTDKKAQGEIRKFWANLGAKVICLGPDSHDKILSFVSHLPHIAAFSLIQAVPKQYLKFAASGLRDTTRIASSESELWSDIFLSNRKNILKSIRVLELSLNRIKSAINKKDKRSLNIILKSAKSKRDSLGL